jgi:hypothetical protein
MMVPVHAEIDPRGKYFTENNQKWFTAGERCAGP